MFLALHRRLSDTFQASGCAGSSVNTAGGGTEQPLKAELEVHQRHSSYTKCPIAPGLFPCFWGSVHIFIFVLAPAELSLPCRSSLCLLWVMCQELSPRLSYSRSCWTRRCCNCSCLCLCFSPAGTEFKNLNGKPQWHSLTFKKEL